MSEAADVAGLVGELRAIALVKSDVPPSVAARVCYAARLLEEQAAIHAELVEALREIADQLTEFEKQYGQLTGHDCVEIEHTLLRKARAVLAKVQP